MAIDAFKPEVWSAELLVALEKALVYAAPGVVNRDYEGEIAQYGDTVRITSLADPTIGTYTPHTDITIEDVDDSNLVLLINQSKYFAFEIDDVDMAQIQNGGGLMTEAALESAYGLADAVDLYVAALYAGADAANKITTTAVTSSLIAAQGLINLKVKLDNANVPTQSRYALIPPWFHGLLLQPGSGFVSVADSGTSEALRNGNVGRAFGFDVFLSNNVTNVVGDDYLVSAGYTGAITFASQINKVEAFRPESSFSEALKGLNLYGAKLVRPSGIATLVASIT